MSTCLSEYLDFYATNRADRILVADDNSELSFAAAKREVDSLAAGIQKQGIKKSDRVAILAKNSVEHLLVYLACAKLGVVPVGLNYRLTSDEWNFIVEDAEIKMIFADAEFLTQLQSPAKDLPCVCIYGEAAGVQTLEDFKADPSELTPVSVEFDDVLFQMYTSGTTGHPKGVLLSHKNVISNTHQPIFTTGYFPDENDHALIVAPLYHAAGLISALCSIVFGSRMFIHRDYDPVRLITDIPEKKITGLTAIPVMLQFSIACVPEIREIDFSSLRCITYGASPISVDLLKECLDIFACDFSQAYGQTETAGGLTILTPADHEKALNGNPDLLRSCGRAILGTQVRVVDENDQPLPNGEVGEIVAKGVQNMRGYWNREEATAETLSNGWLHTGDAGYIDDEGYVYLCDRIKDIIISGGENIYPAEVENIILSHEKINDAAIIGVPDEKWGEVPMLIVAGEKNNDSITLEELDQFCRERIAAYKIPKHIEFIAELPRNPSGKVLKKELRKTFC